MTNNYNSLSCRLDSRLKSLEPDVVGNSPNSGKMRASSLMSLIIIFSLLSGFIGFSQVAPYTFSQSSGTPLTLSSATALGTQTVANGTAVGALDDNNYTIALPFAFTFSGVTYAAASNVYVNTNGFVSFGATAPTAGTYGPIGSTNVFAGAISAYGADSNGGYGAVGSTTSGSAVITITSGSTAEFIVGAPVGGTGVGTGATVVSTTATTVTVSVNSISTGTLRTIHVGTGRISYQVLGVSPNRKLVIDFQKMRRYNLTLQTMNYQIVLNETTNIVDIIYGTALGNPTSTTFQVGLRGSVNTDYVARSSTTSWSATTAGTSNLASVTYSSTVLPASGQTFTYSPPPPCAGAPSPGNTIASNASPCYAGATALSLQNTTTGTGVTYQWFNTSGSISGATSATYVASNITVATNYYCNVTCTASGITTASNSVTVTPSAPSTFPFLETFDATSASASCWTVSAGTGATIQWAYYTTDATHGAAAPAASTRFAGLNVFNAATASNTYNLFSPTFVLDATPKNFTYSYYMGTNGYHGTTGATGLDPYPMQVFISVNGGAYTSIYQHSNSNTTYAIDANSPWQSNTINLTAYAGSTVKFAFASNSNFGSTFCNQGVDEVAIETIPTCFKPTGTAVSAITNNSATVSWVAPVSGTPASYQYEVRSSGLAGSGATGLAASGTTTSPTVTAPVSGLVGNTNYILYVRTFCGGVDFSSWTSGTPFKTSCDPLSVLPYNEGFESLVTANTLPACMSAFPAVASGGKTQTYIAAATGTNSALTARTGSKFAAVYYLPNAKGTFFSAPLTLTAGKSYTASVYYRTDGVAWPTVGLYFGTSNTEAGMTGTISAVTAAVSNGAYTLITGTFVPATTGVYYIGMQANNTSSNAPNYCAFDDLSVIETPPTITSFSPTTICSADAATTTVTLTGFVFTGVTSVKLNGVETPFTVVNDTSITVALTSGSTGGTFVVSNGVFSGTSATSLVINASPVVDAITGGNELCIPTVLSLSDNTPTGTWSSSNTAIATVDNAGFVTGVAAGTVTISYAVTVNGCTTTVTKVVTISQPVVITSQPASQTVLTGNNTSFTVIATGTGLSYSWEESSDSGVTFTPLTNTGAFSGVNTSSLSITGTTAMMNGNEYRCVISGTSPCSPLTSNSAVLTVGTTGIPTQPVDVSLCDSGTAQFFVVTSGTVNGYQWYEDQGFGATPITNGGNYSGANTDTLTISGVTTANNGFTYYVIVDGPANDPQSNSATLNVGTGVTFTSQPTDQTVCYSGGSSIFSVVPAGSFTTYQWQYSADNVTFTNVSNGTPVGATYTNATAADLTVATTGLTPATGTYYYRAVIGANAPCLSVNSATAQLLINTPVVSTQPVATSVFAGNTTTFTVSSVSSAPTYQWQRSTTLNGTYTNVVNGTPANVTYSGETSSTLNVSTTIATVASTANFYRAVISSPVGCSVNSVGRRLTITNYCTSNATSTADDDIAQVTFGTLVNPAVAPSPLTGNVNATGTYSNFTNLPVQDFIQSTTYPLEIKQFNGDIYYACWTKIFFDWNKDGDFSDPGETFNGVGGIDGPSTAPTSGVVFSSNITIPLSASLGITRMRIVLDESGTATSTADGCGTYTWGETEDYLINILPAPICTGTPSAGTAASSATATCANSTVNLATTGYSAGVSGLTFQWYSRALPAGTFAPISGAISDTFTTSALTVSSEFYCTVTCSSTSFSSNTNTVAVTVNNCEYNVTRNNISYSSIMSSGTAYTSLSSSDDGKTNNVSLAGTTFRYNGAAVTGFYATSNGWMTFNTAQTSATFTNDLTSTGQNNVLAPFWDDLVIQGNLIANKDTSMKYKIVGTLGSGTADIILEWAEMEKFLFGDPNLNFQIVMHESDNSIEYNYGTMQLFNGASNGSAWSYSVGLNGSSPATATFANRAALQFADSANFATTSQNSLTNSPSCNSQIRFVPAATFTSGVAPSTIPVNDEIATATTLPVNDDACVSVCGNVYSSKNATASTGIAVCSATTPGTPDDDVFFTFNTNATNTNYKISVQASFGYEAVVQVLDATLTPVACINASAVGLTETFASITLATSTQYYLRVYDAATGVAGGSTGSGEFAICINQILPPPAYDEPAGAIALTVGTSCTSTPSISSEILRATATTGIQVCNAATAGTPDDDVWYKFTTPANATGITYNIRVQGNSTYNAVAQVFQGLPSTGNSIGCANSTGNGGLESLSGAALVSNTDYYIRVYHSGSGAANGSFSICVLATVPSCVTTATAPVNASSFCQSASGTSFSWPAVTNATAYDVYLDNAAGTTLVSANQTAVTYTSSVLAPGSYTWKVVPKNFYGSATACSTFTFTVLLNKTYYADADGDGYGNDAITLVNCVATPGYVLVGGDCNDNVASIHPGAVDVCYDGIDNDCNGNIDNVGLPGGCTPIITVVQSAQCGVTLATIDQEIFANLVAGAQGYRFRVTNTATNQVQTIDRFLRVFRITQLPVFAFNTTYQVEVSVRINNVWQPFYGAPCTVSTPATTTQLQSAQCGGTITSMADVIYANLVPFATGYRFRVTNLVTSAQQVLVRSLREFRMNLLTNPSYNATYSVEVAVRNTDGTYLPYGPVCNITTPSFPTSEVQTSQCDYTALSTTETIYANSVTGATVYRFKLTNPALGYSYTIDRSLRTFTLASFPGLQSGTTYTIQVSLQIGGVFGPYGKACSLTTPGVARQETTAPVKVEASSLGFRATAYPNPFASDFKLNVTTSSEEKVQVRVYDMLGKLIEDKQVATTEIENLEVGASYPSGVYNVIVSQGENTQTLRVIKR